MTADNYHGSRLQFGLRSVLMILSLLSFIFAIAVQNDLGTVMFLVGMLIWAWICIRLAMGLVVGTSGLMDLIHKRP